MYLKFVFQIEIANKTSSLALEQKLVLVVVIYIQPRDLITMVLIDSICDTQISISVDPCLILEKIIIVLLCF